MSAQVGLEGCLPIRYRYHPGLQLWQVSNHGWRRSLWLYGVSEQRGVELLRSTFDCAVLAFDETRTEAQA